MFEFQYFDLGFGGGGGDIMFVYLLLLVVYFFEGFVYVGVEVGVVMEFGVEDMFYVVFCVGE